MGVAAQDILERGEYAVSAPSRMSTHQPAPANRVDDLVAVVGAIAGTLQSGAEQSDREGRLPDASVEALRANGFWRMRLCRAVGGLELPIVAQIRVIAALAAEDASSAWCTMIANNGVAMIGATMPDATITRVFAGGVPACSIVAAPGGVATPVQGGYELTGIWRLASAIHHAEWVHAAAFVDRDPSRLLPLAIPARDVELLDTWNVVGLAGTGSNDFRLTGYFLPAELTGRVDNPYGQVRGDLRYDLVELDQVESYEHLAFAIGVARRALREQRSALANPAIGRSVADREVVQSQLGQAVVELQAVEALAFCLYTRVDDAMAGHTPHWSPSDRHLPRALAVWATQLALRCTQTAFHRSGLAGLNRPNVLEKLLRDMGVASMHAMVDDGALASYAQHLIETGTPPPALDQACAPTGGR